MGRRMQKILALESLRGIAALIVVMEHFFQSFLPAIFIGTAAPIVHSKIESLILASPLNVFVNGNFAVYCFFVLSGFVLSYGFFSKTGKIDLIAAVVKRYFRLAPIVLVSVLLSFFLLRLGLYHTAEVAGITGSDWLARFWETNVAASFPVALWKGVVGSFIINLDNQVSLNPVLWTISYELIGSLIVYSFLALTGRDKRRWMVYLLFIILFINTYYSAFIVGALLCDLYVNRPAIFDKIKNTKRGYKIAAFIVAITIASFPAYVRIGDSDVSALHASLLMFNRPDLTKHLLYVIASVIFIVLILTSTGVRRMLEKRPFVALGSLSYSLYATHLLVLWSVGMSTFLWCIRFLSYRYSMLVAFITFIVCSLISAYLFRKYIDNASINLSRTIGQKVTSRYHRKDPDAEALL